MIDLNVYQTLVYTKLKELSKELDISIYDKVPANAKFPFIILAGFSFEDGLTKDYNCLLIDQKFEIWSDYNGKKEINTITTKANEKLNELHGAELNDSLAIDTINLMPSTVDEVEGFFNANLNVQFEIL